MVACALYVNDARIKSYVKTLTTRGHSVDVLMLRERVLGQDKDDSVGFYHLSPQYQGTSRLQYAWSYLRFFISSLLTLSYLSLRKRYDAIHVHNMPNVLVFAAVVPRLLGAKIVLDVHDLMPANYMAKFGASESHWMVRCLVLEQRLSAMFANHVLCADHSQEEFLSSVCRVPKRKLGVVLNLPNEDVFQKTPRTKSSDRFDLVYHGTIAHRLGVDILLKAVSLVPRDVPVHLSIYGTGDFVDEAVECARTLGVEDRVFFSRSFFPVESIPELVGSMNLGVIGNRKTLACDRFMLPVKLLEYVYLGIPVIAPRLQIINRYFDDSMVRYYEPENAQELARCIVDLFRNPDERERLVKNSSRFYTQFNWVGQGEAYMRLLSHPA